MTGPSSPQARLDILKIHSRKMNLTRGINLRKIAELMPGASGAEVKVSAAEPKLSGVGRGLLTKALVGMGASSGAAVSPECTGSP